MGRRQLRCCNMPHASGCEYCYARICNEKVVDACSTGHWLAFAGRASECLGNFRSQRCGVELVTISIEESVTGRIFGVSRQVRVAVIFFFDYAIDMWQQLQDRFRDMTCYFYINSVYVYVIYGYLKYPSFHYSFSLGHWQFGAGGLRYRCRGACA